MRKPRQGRYPSLRLGFFVFLLAGPLSITGAWAQSSLGRAANGATGQSLRDAIEQAQKNLIDREVLGAFSDPSSSGGTTSTGGGTASSGGGAGFGAGVVAAPTGRVRSSDHDALHVSGSDENNYAWDTDEASAFATGVYTVPGVTFGGQLKLSFLAGYNWLSLEMKNGGGNVLDVPNGQFGKAENESALVSGAALWSKNNVYALASIVGMWGETTLSDAIDFCNGPGLGCPLRQYEFDTIGFMGSLTAGYVFALSSLPTGPKLDLRAAAGYAKNDGESFANFEGDIQKYKFSNFTLTGSATLFSSIPLQNAAVLRPYIQGYVREEVDYKNKLFFDWLNPAVSPNSGVVHWDQASTYGGVDVGLTYTIGQMTVGSAVYYDASADEETIGGRLGATWKFD